MSIKNITRTAAQLTFATGLAAAALVGTAATAHAEEPTPVIVLPPNNGDPKPLDIAQPTPEPVDPQDGPDDKAPVPQPEPDPKPQGPGDIATPEDDGPKGPGDITNPEDDNDPTGPGDLTNPQPCPTHGVDCGGNDDGGNGGGGNGGGGNGGGSETETPKQVNLPSNKPAIEVVEVTTPTRVDAGLAPAAQEQDGMELAWLLAGGALVTATGTAYVVRRKRTARATA